MKNIIKKHFADSPVSLLALAVVTFCAPNIAVGISVALLALFLAQTNNVLTPHGPGQISDRRIILIAIALTFAAIVLSPSVMLSLQVLLMGVDLAAKLFCAFNNELMSTLGAISILGLTCRALYSVFYSHVMYRHVVFALLAQCIVSLGHEFIRARGWATKEYNMMPNNIFIDLFPQERGSFRVQAEYIKNGSQIRLTTTNANGSVKERIYASTSQDPNEVTGVFVEFFQGIQIFGGV